MINQSKFLKENPYIYYESLFDGGGFTTDKIKELYKYGFHASIDKVGYCYLNKDGKQFLESNNWLGLLKKTEDSDLLERVEEQKLKAILEIQKKAISDELIIWRSQPFPSNHLYCVSGQDCDFAIHTDFVDVYLKM